MPKLSLKVFQAQIEPILMYGSEVLFIGKEILDFETVHLSFLKNMLEVKQQTTSVTIYGYTGRYPLFLKQQILALKYWIRLISLPWSCYLRIVYNSLSSLDFIGETNWCSHIRSLLFRTNHRDVWENHRVENANRLIKQVKSCLINTYKVDWPIEARNSTKLRTYIKFKFKHSLEEYLFYIPDTRWMKALSRLGMSSHTRNWTRKACQAAKTTTRTAHMSKMYIKLCWWRNSFFNYRETSMFRHHLFPRNMTGLRIWQSFGAAPPPPSKLCCNRGYYISNLYCNVAILVRVLVVWTK